MTTLSTIDAIGQAWSLRKSALTGRSRQLAESRDRIIRDLVASGIPNTRSEDWKYTSLRSVLEKKYDLTRRSGNGPAKMDASSLSAARALIESRIAPDAVPVVFVDGQLYPELSALSELANLETLEQAEVSRDVDWWDSWQTHGEQTTFVGGLTMGLARDGFVLTVPKGVVTRRPVHLLHLSSGQNVEAGQCVRFLIDIKEGASVQIFEDYIGQFGPQAGASAGHLTLAHTQIRVGPNARAGYYRVVTDAPSSHLGEVSAILDRSSRLDTFSLVAGAKLARVGINVKYTAPDAECRMNGLYLVDQAEHVDHHTSVDHAIDHCRTHQFYKGILNGNGRAVFNGKIYIRKGTLGSEAYQTNKNLLLSPDAEVDTKPQLEIDSDDVKASHGAAIGSINPMELFYLRSRCIAEADAVAMLCRAFADDVVLKCENAVAGAVLSRRVAAWFDRVIAGRGTK